MDNNHEAYQGLLKRLEEKNCLQYYKDKDWYAAYDNGILVCCTCYLDYLESIRFPDGSKIVYFKIDEDEMHEL